MDAWVTSHLGYALWWCFMLIEVHWVTGDCCYVRCLYMSNILMSRRLGHHHAWHCLGYCYVRFHSRYQMKIGTFGSDMYIKSHLYIYCQCCWLHLVHYCQCWLAYAPVLALSRLDLDPQYQSQLQRQCLHGRFELEEAILVKGTDNVCNRRSRCPRDLSLAIGWRALPQRASAISAFPKPQQLCGLPFTACSRRDGEHLFSCAFMQTAHSPFWPEYCL
jgi:hypothetical protein